jgi:hypothetical protein
MIQLLRFDEITIEFLETISPTERSAVSTGVLCKNCGRRIMPFVVNGIMSPTLWLHLHRNFKYGFGVVCDNGRGSKAEPLVTEVKL